MKSTVITGLTTGVLVFLILLHQSCGDKAQANPPDNAPISKDISKKISKRNLNGDFKSYWYDGEAEITSYRLEQARYGELRTGHAVLVFVTEPFLAEEQVKANSDNPANIPVLKLNSSKKYLTGIYPYSIMSSTFYPVHHNLQALKVSSSIQEWCGHVYSQLNNRKEFEFISHSYFEGEGDQQKSLEKDILENELWNMIRVHPENLPTGSLKVIPSLEYIRTAHIPIKAYTAEGSIKEISGLTTYTLNYPELNRSLSIVFTSAFPHSIEQWTDAFKSGYGPNTRELTSKAVKIKRIKTPYWRQNSNKDLIYRDSLGL